MEKVILYGMGRHAEKVFKGKRLPLSMVEIVIDKNFKGQGVEVITWERYVETKECYGATKLVICPILYYDEIKSKVLESGLFEKGQIVSVDEWLSRVAEVDDCYDGRLISDLFEKNEKSVHGVKALSQEMMENAKVLADRSETLKRFPKNLVVAEVGVAYGDFTRKILDEMQPQKFYAMDIFSTKSGEFWGEKRFEESQMNHLQYYEDRFSKEIEEGVVEIVKGLSWDVLEQFPDDFFDYVYLDADHSYESVLKDVEVLKRKVKNGGIIQFNDYILYDYYRKEYYGVVQAVNQLLRETGSEVLYYCLSTDGFDDMVVRLKK